MPKLTFNDLPAAVEALLLRMDILHDLVKSTRDTLDSLIREAGELPETADQKPVQNVPDEKLPEREGLLDIGKAARYLGISNSTLYMAVERRAIAHFRKQNRLYFKVADLDAYKQSQKSGKKKSAKPMLDEPTMLLGDNDEKLMSMEEATEYTGISKTNLYSYVKMKKVPFIKKGRRLYFPVVALNQLMIMSTEKPTRPRGRKKKTTATEPKEPPAGNPDPDYVTLRQVVKMIGKHPSTVYYQLRKMNVPVVARRGNLSFYSLRAVREAFPETG
ncbi:MAG TPA: helix-turn-helix domain-containing protein [Bacteroidales bacterium]|nr:helix-turn-helix domain-containing protein [Bacteroidales bacterium]